MATKKGFKSAARTRRKQRRKKIEVRKTEFKFHGLTIKEMQKLPMDELLPLIPSRARRTLKRGLNKGQEKLLNDVEKAEKGNIIRTHYRDMVILPSFIGHKIDVYNGNEFQRVDIDPHMVGHYLGEFSLTRKKVKHTGPGVGATRSSKFMPLK